MSVQLVFKQERADDLLRVQYQNNVHEIKSKIHNQFIRAVKGVNDELYEKYHCRIFVLQHENSRKHGIPYGKEFDYMRSYEISISTGDEVNYEIPLRYDEGCILYLGSFYAYDGERAVLKEMAQQGQISDFQEVYDHWENHLRNEIVFFKEHEDQVQSAKQQINTIFIAVIKKIDVLIKRENYLGTLQIGSTPSIGRPYRVDDLRFEPLKEYGMWNYQAGDNYVPLIGSIKIIPDGQSFKRIVLLEDREQAGKEISDRVYSYLENRVCSSNRQICCIS